jgi:hypothetical protein
MGIFQMIPSTFKYTMEGSTPSWTDNEGQAIEKGAQVRLRIKGMRMEIDKMSIIGSIREDYLGYVCENLSLRRLTLILLAVLCYSELLQRCSKAQSSSERPASVYEQIV